MKQFPVCGSSSTNILSLYTKVTTYQFFTYLRNSIHFSTIDKLLVQNNFINSLFTQINKQHGNTVVVLITHSSQLTQTTSH